MALTYNDIKDEFITKVKNDKRAQAIVKEVEAGLGTYATAADFSIRVGQCLADILRKYAPLEMISEWDVENLIPGSLGRCQQLVTTICRAVQESLNLDAGLHLKYIQPEFDRDRCWGMVNELLEHENFADIEASFYDQLVNFNQNVVDESIRTNARMLNNAGISSKVIRTPDFRACAWCREVAGTYDYEEVKGTGDDVWRRHENCRCIIDYVTERNGAVYTERVYEGR